MNFKSVFDTHRHRNRRFLLHFSSLCHAANSEMIRLMIYHKNPLALLCLLALPLPQRMRTTTSSPMTSSTRSIMLPPPGHPGGTSTPTPPRTTSRHYLAPSCTLACPFCPRRPPSLTWTSLQCPLTWMPVNTGQPAHLSRSVIDHLYTVFIEYFCMMVGASMGTGATIRPTGWWPTRGTTTGATWAISRSLGARTTAD